MYLSPPLFPVHLDDVPSNVTFHDAPEEAITIGSATVRASKVQHQGPTVGYRIEENGRAFVYLPDHEPSLGADLNLVPPEWMSGHDIAHGADLLFHDAQYRNDEYPHHVGWGHSGIAHVIEFARKADVKKVVLFHHDPYHTDDELEELLVEAKAASNGAADWVRLAYEGMTFVLDKAVVRID
jgi:ribonuclease BN (tRNA processing enzyme)